MKKLNNSYDETVTKTSVRELGSWVLSWCLTVSYYFNGWLKWRVWRPLTSCL